MNDPFKDLPGGSLLNFAKEICKPIGMPVFNEYEADPFKEFSDDEEGGDEKTDYEEHNTYNGQP